MRKKITVLIDGGHLRSYLKRARKPIDADYIEKVGLSCRLATEEIMRILYYDCALYNGETRWPVSGTIQTFTQSTPYLHDLSRKDLFAVRRGVLKFRGYVIKPRHQPSNPLVDSDFMPRFEQKGVDMRIGARHGDNCRKPFRRSHRSDDERHGLCSCHEIGAPRRNSSHIALCPRMQASSRTPRPFRFQAVDFLALM